MRAGQLDERVTIQAESNTQNEIGEPVSGWADVLTCWADVEDVSGREYVAAGATQNSALTRIVVRHDARIKAAHRAIHNGIQYNIESVLGKDRIHLTLMCKRMEP